jgi:CRP/FNR family transcriptional regulator, cyclic AMP receptor protein
MESAFDLLATQPFLAGLSDRQLELLSRCARRSMFHAGNRVFRVGDQADRFWFIKEGRVNLHTDLPQRGDVVVDTLGPAAVLGWSWLFRPYRWRFGATAVETTLTVELDGQGVRNLCERDPAIGYELTSRFVQVVVERLRATRLRLPDVLEV